MIEARKNASSIYKGVSMQRGTGKFRAYVWDGTRQVNLGTFDSEVDAAMAYNVAAIKLGRPKGNLNLNGRVPQSLMGSTEDELNSQCETRDLYINGRRIIVSEFGDILVESKLKASFGHMTPAHFNVSGYGYLKASIGGAHYFCHRLVCMAFTESFDESMVVNHIDGNKLNNHIDNLEQLSHADNIRAYNNKAVGLSSIYRGVWEDRRRGVFCSQITHEGKRVNVGSFKSEHDAARAYNRKAIELGWPSGCLNKIGEGN